MLGDSNTYATLPVSDLAKARDFYENKLGLAAEKEDPGGISYKTGNTSIFVYPSEYAGTNQGTAVAWEVEDFDGAVNFLREKGVVFEHYDNLEGVKLEGDVHVMGPFKAVWFKDPSGNILNAMSRTG